MGSSEVVSTDVCSGGIIGSSGNPADGSADAINVGGIDDEGAIDGIAWIMVKLLRKIKRPPMDCSTKRPWCVPIASDAVTL